METIQREMLETADLLSGKPKHDPYDNVKGYAWAKGQSGNKRGRPKKDKNAEKMAMKHASKAIKTLAEIMEDDKAADSNRITAANSLLDRAFGKARQSIDVDAKLSLSEEFEDFITHLNAKNNPILTVNADAEDCIDAVEDAEVLAIDVDPVAETGPEPIIEDPKPSSGVVIDEAEFMAVLEEAGA